MKYDSDPRSDVPTSVPASFLASLSKSIRDSQGSEGEATKKGAKVVAHYYNNIIIMQTQLKALKEPYFISRSLPRRLRPS